MDHNKIKEMLPLYVDGGLNADETRLIEEHIKKCASCASELEIYKSNYEYFSNASEIEPPEGFADSVMEKINKAAASAPLSKKETKIKRILKYRIQVPVSAIGLAASLILIVSLLNFTGNIPSLHKTSSVETYERADALHRGVLKEDASAFVFDKEAVDFNARSLAVAPYSAPERGADEPAVKFGAPKPEYEDKKIDAALPASSFKREALNEEARQSMRKSSAEVASNGIELDAAEKISAEPASTSARKSAPDRPAPATLTEIASSGIEADAAEKISAELAPAPERRLALSSPPPSPTAPQLPALAVAPEEKYYDSSLKDEIALYSKRRQDLEVSNAIVSSNLKQKDLRFESDVLDAENAIKKEEALKLILSGESEQDLKDGVKVKLLLFNDSASPVYIKDWFEINTEIDFTVKDINTGEILSIDTPAAYKRASFSVILLKPDSFYGRSFDLLNGKESDFLGKYNTYSGWRKGHSYKISAVYKAWWRPSKNNQDDTDVVLFSGNIKSNDLIVRIK